MLKDLLKLSISKSDKDYNWNLNIILTITFARVLDFKISRVSVITIVTV